MRIDWHRVAENIAACGYGTQRRVSTRCGMHKDWLSQFRGSGQYEPHFEAGLKLLRAHLELCGKEKHREIIKRG